MLKVLIHLDFLRNLIIFDVGPLWNTHVSLLKLKRMKKGSRAVALNPLRYNMKED
jgi:hypothetical protein